MEYIRGRAGGRTVGGLGRMGLIWRGTSEGKLLDASVGVSI